jgi:hypothetical protein
LTQKSDRLLAAPYDMVEASTVPKQCRQ